MTRSACLSRWCYLTACAAFAAFATLQSPSAQASALPDTGPRITHDPLLQEARSAFLRRFMVLEQVARGRQYGVRTLAAMSGGLPDRLSDTCGALARGLENTPWRVILADRDTVDLDRFLDPRGSVAYLARPLRADRRTDGQLLIGSAGAVKVWLNGRLVHADGAHRRHRRDRSAVPVRFEPGCNDLVIRVARGERWRVSVRVADRNGYHLEGVAPAPLPTPPAVAPLPPLVVAPGADLEIPLCVETGVTADRPGERTAANRLGSPGVGALSDDTPDAPCSRPLPPTVRVERSGLPRFARLQPGDTPVLSLSPGPRKHGQYPDGAIVVSRGPAISRVPLYITVARQVDLRVTEAFDAIQGCRYPLRMAVTDPLGRRLDLAGVAAWNSSDPAVGRVTRAGVFEAVRPGRTRVSGRYGGLEATIPIEVVRDRPGNPYRTETPTIDTLVAIYRTPSCTRCPELARRAATEGRLFIYRNTNARLNLALDFVTLEGPLPNKRGSYFRGVEADLKRRGLNRRKPGIVAGLGESEGPCYGSGQMFGAAAIHCSVLKPTFFVHEIQHTLDRVITEESGLPDMVYGHGYTDPSAFGMPAFPIPAGRGAHWEASVLRQFDDYDRLAPPWNTTITVVDSDGDGLADADSRLPIDERRLGSNPFAPDSDRDGLDDLDEFRAGIYHGSDPVVADTDGDGTPDGADRWPLYDIPGNGVIPYLNRSPEPDGALREAWPVLVRGYDTAGQCLNNLKSCKAHGTVTVYAGWNENGLHLAVSADARIQQVFIDLDGSGRNGPYLGGDFFALVARRSDQSLGVSTATFPERSRKTRVIRNARVAFGQENRQSVVELTVPAGLGPGNGWDCRYLGRACNRRLRLEPGQVVSLALRIETGRYAVTPFEKEVFVPFVLGVPGKEGRRPGTNRPAKRRRRRR